jgi:protocatechuate 3,4-dioxygenase alpha subunit
MNYSTPSQTVGPYLHIGLHWLNGSDMLAHCPQVSGERIRIEGHLFDGLGKPISDGMIEVWQANSHGRYAHPEDHEGGPLEDNFTGFGRCATGPDGGFAFDTIKPGRVAGSGKTLQAPHLVVSVFARGVLKRLCTRLYFADETGNASDPVLLQVPQARRATLISRVQDGVHHWNIVIQGQVQDWPETVFFDV